MHMHACITGRPTITRQTPKYRQTAKYQADPQLSGRPQFQDAGGSDRRSSGLGPGPTAHDIDIGSAPCPMSRGPVPCPMALSCVLWPCPVLCPLALSYFRWPCPLALSCGTFLRTEESEYVSYDMQIQANPIESEQVQANPTKLYTSNCWADPQLQGRPANNRQTPS